MTEVIPLIVVWGTIICFSTMALLVTARFAWDAFVMLYDKTPLGSWVEQRLASRTCPTCRKRVPAILADEDELCPNHLRLLRHVRRLESSLLDVESLPEVPRRPAETVEESLERHLAESRERHPSGDEYVVQDGAGRTVRRFVVENGSGAVVEVTVGKVQRSKD